MKTLLFDNITTELITIIRAGFEYPQFNVEYLLQEIVKPVMSAYNFANFNHMSLRGE